MGAEGLLSAPGREWLRGLRARARGVVCLVGVCGVLGVSVVAQGDESAERAADARANDVGRASDDKSANRKRRRLTAGLIHPRRVTIGDHNHFMGVLGPNGRYVYYVTDEHKAYDLYVQSPVSSAGKPLFDAFGDITWPAISPDGEEVAYIRYETDSRGDACRRKIRSNGKARDRQEDCRTTEDADLQIYWRSDGRLGVLTREELHGDHVLLEGTFDKAPKRIEANVVGLAISPGERWVAFVPLERLREEIGVSFSNQTSTDGIVLRRGIEGKNEFAYEPALPGVSGYPVFSPDGKHLYFSQFPNDTNRDGIIDGEDNGVLFRVPFDGEGEEPAFGQPRQLTSARWNCLYPSVREKAMAITCGIGDNLHIYLLPPTGTVPADWDRERIASEAETTIGRWNVLLLRQHLLVSAEDDDERLAQLKALTKQHLDLREYEAAIYYGERRSALMRERGESDWWAELMIRLAKHRRADLALSRGRFSREYVAESESLIESVKAVETGGAADGEAFRALVLSRIYSDLGDKATADRLLREVDVVTLRDEAVLDFAFQQFDHFFGLLADDETRIARVKEVALNPESSVTQRLRHSNRVLVLLQRGHPKDARLGRLVGAREGVPDGTLLAAALDIEIALYALTEENADEVGARLMQLYKKTDNVHVRRYLIVSALRAANRQQVESLQHSLVELWVESVEGGDAQRQTSDRVYRLVVLERAYGAYWAGDMKTAADYFDKARKATDSLAGYVGWIESQLQLGAPERAKEFETEREATRLFVEAYWLGRDLGAIESNEELDETVGEMRELLEAAIEEDPRQPLSHLLLAHALHHRGMRFGSREDVAQAVRHYLLALDLGERRPRVRSSAHSGMAIAQASLGNHRRALEDYEARLRLPMVSEEEEAAVLLGYARSLFHVNDKEEAVETAERALGIVRGDEAPKPGSNTAKEAKGGANGAADRDLAQYEPLFLDRLALYALDARKKEEAIETHEELKHSLETHPEAASAVNEVKVRARLSAAELYAKKPEAALESATRGMARLDEADPLRPADMDRRVRPVTHEFAYDEEDLRAMLAGLEANAARQVGKLEKSRAALLVRKHALDERYEVEQADEDLLELALTCLRLADVANQQRDLEQTRLYLEEGLGYESRHVESSGTEISEVGLHLLRAYALLHFEGGVALEVYQRDLEADLLRYYLFLSEVRNPEWEKARGQLELFLALLRMERGDGGGARGGEVADGG